MELLSEFVRDALVRGADRDQIARALADAGWSGHEIDEALHGWETVPGLPPVPRPRAYASFREAVLYGLLFLSLAIIAWRICDLGMELIDRLIPDPADIRTYRADGSIRWPVASLIVFTPLFVWLSRKAQGQMRDDAGQRRSLVRKWFASVTLLLALLVLLGDGVTVIFTLLNGELTARFAAKAVLVAAVAALVFGYCRDALDD
ncbi:hypothetical protein SAMN04487972_10673 [Paracoccus halophilus]|uniref:DUF5671 domain-containing protein n=1 Tax=Paracoccus halophilus TaxID=376733 RepID=A0A099F3S3_9RHOB|nr:DUF5671 domain-containing protein [Paracoccus halophilus]KGJ05365.1 hypothetical protein IT41_06225 [Paracoccus halophilus]SFA48884.1 hypothetical protein SAMN04487972_10673 [Paracoccus halophilus]